MYRNIKCSGDTHVNALRKFLIFYFQVEECVEPERRQSVLMFMLH